MDTTLSTCDQLTPVTGQFLRVLGDLLAVRAVGADTGGAYALFEARTPPGAGMPAHLQRQRDQLKAERG